MPHLRVAPDCELFHRDECFADPWESPAAALPLHGNAESGEAWNGWMPTLGRRLRVVRPDMRGFGRSAPMPRDFAWSVDRIVDGYVSLADALGLDCFHLAAAKVAGPLAIRLAARHPGRARSLVLLGTLVSGSDALGDRHAAWLEHIERHGVESWARWTMPGRLGGAAPPAVAEGWARLMGATPLSTQLGFIGAVPSIDVRGDLARRLPDAGGDDRRRRAGLGRGHAGLAAADPRVGDHGGAGRFLPRGGDARGGARARDAGLRRALRAGLRHGRGAASGPQSLRPVTPPPIPPGVVSGAGIAKLAVPGRSDLAAQLAGSRPSRPALDPAWVVLG